VTGLVLAGVALALATVPALLFLVNLLLYRPAPVVSRERQRPERASRSLLRSLTLPARPLSVADAPDAPAISVLIPARNEERSIVAAVESALASRGATVEVVVLDDHSTDGTRALVDAIGRRDARVRLLSAPPLPAGWCGKQHACHVLSGAARHDLLAFLDADVRLESDGLARLAGFLGTSGADLVSGVPLQETGSLLERLVIPLIHFVLLGFLPLVGMRRSRKSRYAAGCGQLFLTRREAYQAVGGHAVIRTTLHDGIRLPHAYRAAGRVTDLCDATDLARCRMYRSGGELWHGLAKNATEGLAAPGLIVPATLVLLGGQVLPVVLLACAGWLSAMAAALAGLAAALAWLPRLLGVLLFRQSLLGAVLHPVGVLVLLAIQWYALGRCLVGRPATWKGRNYRRAGSACSVGQ
jgi:hypothetical protein